MPHKCARCEKIYESDSKELLEGCPCGSRLFLFLRETPKRTEKQAEIELKKSKVHGSDIDWFDREYGDKLSGKNKVVHLDIETMHRIEEGKFKIDVASIMQGKPIVVRAEEGVYYIDIPDAMRRKKKKEKKR